MVEGFYTGPTPFTISRWRVEVWKRIGRRPAGEGKAAVGLFVGGLVEWTEWTEVDPIDPIDAVDQAAFGASN